MNPDELNEQEQRIASMADAMLARGKSPNEVRAFVARAMGRLDTNRREMADAGSAGNLFARGLTSGFADEIAGAGDAAIAAVSGRNPADAYRSTRDAIRMTNRAYEEENPGKAMLAELAGGVVQGVGTGLGVAKAAPSALGTLAARFTPTAVQGAAARLAQAMAAGGARGASARLAQAMTAGGAAGGLAGFGGAEGSLEDRLSGANRGAIGGAIGGAVFHGAGNAMSGVAKRVGLAPRDPNAAGVAGAVGRAQQGLRRATGVGGLTPDESAAVRVGDQIEKAKRPLAQVLDPNASYDPTSMLADKNVGGVQAARLAGSARRLGDEAAELAEDTFGNRTRQRPLKLQADVGRVTGQPRLNIEDELEKLTDQARTASRPFYQEMEQFAATPDPRVREAVSLMPEGIRKRVWGRVRNIAKADGRDLTRELVDENGDLLFDLEPRELDIIKKALDEEIGESAAPQMGGLSRTERGLLTRARGLIIDAADDATGGPSGVYARARAEFGGPASLRGALDEGRESLTMDEGELERAVRSLTPAQRQAFRMGGVESIRAELAKQPEGKLGIPRTFTSTRRRAQADEAFGERAGSWRDILDGEVAREETEGIVMRGSPTAERLADDELSQLGTSIPTSGTGMLSALAGEAIRRGERTAVRGATAREMDAVMTLLTKQVGTPEARAEVMQLLQAGRTARAEIAARAALRRAGVSTYIGGRAGERK